MKAVNTIVKIVVALAAVAGIVYVVATYGDKIVAWAKNLLSCCKSKCQCDCDCECESCDCEEAPAEEVPAEEGEAVAEDTDFEG